MVTNGCVRSGHAPYFLYVTNLDTMILSRKPIKTPALYNFKPGPFEHTVKHPGKGAILIFYVNHSIHAQIYSYKIHFGHLQCKVWVLEADMSIFSGRHKIIGRVVPSLKAPPRGVSGTRSVTAPVAYLVWQ